MREFTYYFWIFVMGSFLGVIIETIWCMLRYKKIESRKGVIYGPFNPLYGTASVVLSYTINKAVDQSIGSIFLIGVVVASVIEYLCSYLQEKITGTVSWDYKNFKYNIKGRINFVYSLFWGFLTLFWKASVLPLIDANITFFYDKQELTIVCAILMGLDCLISLCACIRRKHRREKKYAKTKFEKHLDYIYDDELLDKVYANSKFKDE